MIMTSGAPGPSQIEALLYQLCVELGFCLPPKQRARLVRYPPSDVDAFTDAVFIAEGMRPDENLNLRRKVKRRVLAHFTAAQEAEMRLREMRSERRRRGKTS